VELPVILTVGNAFTVTDDVVLLQPVDVCVKVKVADPAATPVTTPAFVTVATAVLLLLQVPPVVGDKVPVLPIHTDEGAVTIGNAFTVTDAVVLLQPVDVCVNVKVAVPPATPATTPAFVTVATAVLLLLHVPPVVGDKVVVDPAQMVELPVILTVGSAFTVTDDVVLEHPVDVCVKVKVAVPPATPVTTPPLVTVATAVLLLLHVPPVVGDKVPVLPTHIDEGAVTVGNALIVTDDVVLEHPVDVCVKVKVTVPAATAVTTPAFVTVATAVLLLLQVPPVVGDKVPVLPIHIDEGAVKVGNAFTVTELVDPEAVQPWVSVTVNE
jgi:hypothetical protein